MEKKGLRVEVEYMRALSTISRDAVIELIG